MKALLTQSAKEKLLEQFEQSGKTYAQFAEGNGQDVKTFSKWVYKWRHQKKTAGGVKLVEIKTTDLSTAKEIKIRKSGMKIFIPENLDRIQM